MTEIILPFTCKQGIKILNVFRWLALIVFPIVMIYSINQDPDWTKHIQGQAKDASLGLFWGIVGTIVGWTCQGAWWFVGAGIDGKLPHFKCKCEKDSST